MASDAELVERLHARYRLGFKTIRGLTGLPAKYSIALLKLKGYKWPGQNPKGPHFHRGTDDSWLMGGRWPTRRRSRRSQGMRYRNRDSPLPVVASFRKKIRGWDIVVDKIEAGAGYRVIQDGETVFASLTFAHVYDWCIKNPLSWRMHNSDTCMCLRCIERRRRSRLGNYTNDFIPGKRRFPRGRTTYMPFDEEAWEEKMAELGSSCRTLPSNHQMQLIWNASMTEM